MECEVTTYYLEMKNPGFLIPKRLEIHDFEIKKAKIPLPELNRFFYISVGYNWYWNDRLEWTYQQWQEWVDRPELRTWVAYLSGTPIGYFELEAQSNGDVEIAYFGLLPRFIGKGLGGYFLTVAIENAWKMNASRVWVHTCTLDHPVALANYLARGFQIFKEQTQKKIVP
ncbi:GNAT family N-acetyltransferase [Pleurocapsales cyanobacterium LEGE 06147]|nr:GNAT family N-acetyltransferase [Pleurocapsales cyanobacterium LEGE 06147]